MSHLKIKSNWQESPYAIIPETVFQNRRQFLRLMGFTGLGILDGLFPNPVMAKSTWYDPFDWFGSDGEGSKPYQAISGIRRNPAFKVKRSDTDEGVALKYNNFYEFADSKDVWKKVGQFKTDPWSVEVTGQVNRPQKFDLDDFRRHFTLEERIHRHRCVEAWAMVVPWIGFSLSALIRKVEPTSKAKYIRFVSFMDPVSAAGQTSSRLPWPYTEGLTIEEGMNELAFIATGIYGHVLPTQHGAPVRLVIPWKYGFKSIKSITRIEFVETRPETFWNTVAPHEYGFQANVDPDVPHPRWSQRREKMIGTGDVYRTRKFNGYGEWVGKLYR